MIVFFIGEYIQEPLLVYPIPGFSRAWGGGRGLTVCCRSDGWISNADAPTGSTRRLHGRRRIFLAEDSFRQKRPLLPDPQDLSYTSSANVTKMRKQCFSVGFFVRNCCQVPLIYLKVWPSSPKLGNRLGGNICRRFSLYDTVARSHGFILKFGKVCQN
jgi:hypothetical protein